METLKNIKKNSIILLLITIVVLFVLLKDSAQEILGTISKINIFYLLIAFILYFLYIITKAYIIYKCVNEKDNLSFKEDLKHKINKHFINGINQF